MSARRARGQAMVEMAIGVAIFLAVSLGAVQLGSAGFAAEAAQSAALLGARTASAEPLPGNPLLRLAEGQAAAEGALADSSLGMAEILSCASPEGEDDCGLPLRCALYQGAAVEPGSSRACPLGRIGASGPTRLGPAPDELDGPQDPGCGSGSCFGVAASMRPCRDAPAAGSEMVCLAYDAWPAREVDIWVRGRLRSLAPLVSSAGLDALPLSVQLRLQVESLRP